MKKSDENKTENCTIFNEVMLTQNCVDGLRHLQSSDNTTLDMFRDDLADVVCYISIKLLDELPKKEIKKLKTMSSNLAFLRDFLNNFRKP